MVIIRATANLVDNYRSIVNDSREHSVVLDLPVASGGDNTGTSALELAIMSLVGCAVTIFVDVAENSDVELSKLEVKAEANKPATSSTLTNVKLKVKVKGNARDQKMRALWRRTEATCPVVKIFTERIPIESEFKIE